ncbi:MAG: HD domain-containing protein [Eubacteriales bacterium]|nr:HD domain-containing protein [Eubacteriales bacterium]
MGCGAIDMGCLFDLPQHIVAVLDRLEQAGYASYVVGGAVRDSLAGRTPHDYDVCTAAFPQQVEDIFFDHHVIETGLQHGTVTVMMEGEPVEVTTFRTEGSYSDGRRPDSVQFVTAIADDLARRDFTVNAMAYSPQRGLCDPFGGQDDLRRKLLRCVGDPDARLQEDALRILRALRFAAQRGYAIELQTVQALRRNQHGLAHVSAERITAELLQLVCGPYAGTVMMEYADMITGLLPELAPMVGFAQHNPYHKYDVWEHSVRAMESIRPDPLLRLAMLFHDCGKPGTFHMDDNGVGHFYGHPILSYQLAQQAARHLRLPVQMEQELLYLVRHHDTPLGNTVRSVRRKLAVHGETRFRNLLAVKKADCIGQGTTPENLTELLETEALLEQVLAEQGCLTRKDLAVNGNDLLAWGISGPSIGRYLSEMLNRVLDDPSCNTRERLYEIFLEVHSRQGCLQLTVNGISARCCARQVKRLLEALPAVTQVEVALDSGLVKLYGQNIPLDQVQDTLTAAGFEVAI